MRWAFEPQRGKILDSNFGRWDGWMASWTQWTWVWANCGSWWWTGKPGVLQSVGLQRVRHDWATLCGGWVISDIQCISLSTGAVWIKWESRSVLPSVLTTLSPTDAAIMNSQPEVGRRVNQEVGSLWYNPWMQSHFPHRPLKCLHTLTRHSPLCRILTQRNWMRWHTPTWIVWFSHGKTLLPRPRGPEIPQLMPVCTWIL